MIHEPLIDSLIPATHEDEPLVLRIFESEVESEMASYAAEMKRTKGEEIRAHPTYGEAAIASRLIDAEAKALLKQFNMPFTS